VAYTAVKLTDVQKAIAAVTAANKKYTDAQASSKTTETAVNNARKALETAQSKLQSLQSEFDNQNYLSKNTGYKNASTALSAAEKKLNDARAYLDSGQFLEKNAAYQNSLKAITTAEKNRDAAQTRLDNATDKTRASLERALTAANKTVDTAYTNSDRARQAAEKLAQTAISTAEKAYDTSNANLDKARSAAETAYMNGTIKPAQTAVDKANTTFETAQNKYQGLMDSFQPLLDQRNEAINNVSSYVDTIRGSLGDVTKFADAKQVQTLLGQIQTAVNNTKLSDLINPVKSMISEIDPLKMANIPKVNIQGANPDVFSNIDPNTGLPILDQGGLDAVLDRYKSNKIDTQQYRDNWDKFGWNVKSDASTAMRGPAVVGLDMGNIQQGMSGSTRGIVKAGTNQAASDADFKKAADQLGIDINQYYIGKKLDQQSLYNDIADRTKDFYMVANSIDGNKHAALLFRADGSGNLVPVTNEQGAPMVNYYTATRNVTGETWYGGLLPIAAIAASFALPGIGTAFAQSAAGSALAASIGTTAATAVTNAALSASLAAITGGDVSKAALTAGLSSVANSAQIANKIVGEENIAAIAKAANLTRGQVENIIANGLTEGISTAATGQGDVLSNMAKTVASSFASESARNVATKAVLDADQDTISRVADSVANLTNVGTQAALNGLNPIDAIAASAPYIISSTSGVQVEERAPIVDKSVVYGQQEAYQQVLEAFGASPEEAKAEALRMAQQGFKPEQVGEKLAQVTGAMYSDPKAVEEAKRLGIELPQIGLKPVPAGEDKTLSEIQVIGKMTDEDNAWSPYAPTDVWYQPYFPKYQVKAQDLFKQIGQQANQTQVDQLAFELLKDDVVKYGQDLSQAPGISTAPGVSDGQQAGQPGGVPEGVPGGVPGGLPGGTGAGGTGAGGTGEEGTGAEAQKQAALQQYLQQVKAQQQRTQELIDPKSIYYLTPEEQAARGYINPAELYESITPFKRGGLASMKRNAKWQ
jgi:hypothetical protein